MTAAVVVVDDVVDDLAEPTGNYPTAHAAYTAAGWPSVLPLPPGTKSPPPKGCTGAGGRWPSVADVYDWKLYQPSDCNVALRLPNSVAGLDIDQYDDKHGAGNLIAAAGAHGLPPLPPTWRCSARQAPSGIHLYRIPSGARLRGEAVPGVEVIQHHHRYAVAWPSVHPNGSPYRWYDPSEEPADRVPRVDELPELPPGWRAFLSENTPDLRTVDNPPHAVHRESIWHPNVTARHARCAVALRAGAAGSRHDLTRDAVMALARMEQDGLAGSTAALEALGSVFVDQVGDEPGRDAGAEFTRMVDGARGRARRTESPVAAQERADRDAHDALMSAVHAAPAGRLGDLLRELRGYQDLADPGHVLAVLAAAATRDIDDEPAWLLLVAPPSSGKTEAVRMLDGAADAHLNDVTAAGLLSWSKAKQPKPVGALQRIGARGLMTFGDLSNLLATSDRGGRDQVFGMLRRMYDGHVTRDLGNAEHPLEWKGRVTVVAAVTGVIDNYSAHTDALGPRWVNYRIPERDTRAKRRAARLARRGSLSEHRQRARQLAADIVESARRRISGTNVSEAMYDAIEDAALVTCWGRAAVPRFGYGKREIDGPATIEEPPRLIKQLHGMARGLLALGLDEETATALVRKVALDSMPAVRFAVLDALAKGGQALTAEVGRLAGLERGVARRTLEELEVVGIVRSERDGPTSNLDDAETDRRPCQWRLVGEDGALVSRVLVDHESARGCAEKWVPTPQPPKNGDDENGELKEATYISAHPQ